MRTIHTDSVMLNTKGPNQSFGNHLLHLFACWKIAKQLDLELSINCDSNLDELFILDRFKSSGSYQGQLLYTEKYGGSVSEHFVKEIENNDFFISLLQGKVGLPDSFHMKGWFWNSIFLPDASFFQEIKIIPNLLEEVVTGRDYLKDNNTIVIHYRGTDFKSHSIGWGDLRLKEEYYDKCLLDSLRHIDLKRIVIVSDEEPEFISNLGDKYGLEVFVEKNDWKIDWLILLFSKNLICSNSSFCYTAGWYEKNLCYQPLKFLTRYIETDQSYPVFPYYNNKQSKKL